MCMMASVPKEADSSSMSVTFPEPPERPLDSDCCGNGCVPCVFDIYDEEVALWKVECERLKSGQTNQEETQMAQGIVSLQHDRYNSFVIQDISQESGDALRIRCSLSPGQTLGLRTGQHIIIRCQRPEGAVVTRQYTPISPVDVKGYFELIIKIYPKGQMSQIIKSWQVGDKFEARGPMGSLAYARNRYPRVVMLCAGTGVAPMCQVISSVLADESDDTFLRLVYACHSYSQLIAKTEMDEWRRFWNFSAVFVLSQEPNSSPSRYKYGEDVVNGYVDREFIAKELGENVKSAFVLVCGTPAFESDVLCWLKDLGVPKDHVHKF